MLSNKKFRRLISSFLVFLLGITMVGCDGTKHVSENLRLRQTVCRLCIRNRTDQERHISAEIAHCLQALEILADILCREAVYLIPVGTGDDRHAADREVFVQHIKGGSISASAAAHHRGTDLHMLGKRRAVKQSVEK